ncbi:MAG: hypothetical protein ACLUNZ_06075 [Evtepia sp.]
MTPTEAQKTFDAMDWGEKRSLPLTITQPTVTVADLSGQLYPGYAGLLHDEHRRDGQPRGKY